MENVYQLASQIFFVHQQPPFPGVTQKRIIRAYVSPFHQKKNQRNCPGFRFPLPSNNRGLAQKLGTRQLNYHSHANMTAPEEFHHDIWCRKNPKTGCVSCVLLAIGKQHNNDGITLTVPELQILEDKSLFHCEDESFSLMTFQLSVESHQRRCSHESEGKLWKTHPSTHKKNEKHQKVPQRVRTYKHWSPA